MVACNRKLVIECRQPSRRSVPLSKSFEYAYIHAKGEYIFALGSDDGLLPWGLSALEEVIEAFPNEEIIQWE